MLYFRGGIHNNNSTLLVTEQLPLVAQSIPSVPISPESLITLFIYRFPVNMILGTIRSNDGDGNGNAVKIISLISKTTILRVHHAFLDISLPSLHDYDVKNA